MAQESPCNVIVYFCYDPDYNMYYSKKLNDVASDRFQMDIKFLEECSLKEKKLLKNNCYSLTRFMG